jgi:hypothetical protein
MYNISSSLSKRSKASTIIKTGFRRASPIIRRASLTTKEENPDEIESEKVQRTITGWENVFEYIN